MPDLVYNYIPIFGVEPFKEISGKLGGAEETNDNLIITSWGATPKGPSPDFITIGDILVPLSSSDDTPEALRPALVQAMHGRVGARFGFEPGGDKKKVDPFILSVCNPPQELKQQLANSVVFNGGDPDDPLNYTSLKSVQGVFSWKVFQLNSLGVGQNVGFLDGYSVFHSYYIPAFNAADDASSEPIALLRTNGADGEKPEFFDMTTAGGVQECIAAVNKGQFFVAMVTSISPSAAYANTDVYWPHSLTRG